MRYPVASSAHFHNVVEKVFGVAFQQLQVFVTFTVNLLKGYKKKYCSLERLCTTNHFQYGCYKTKQILVMNDKFVNHLVVIGYSFSDLGSSFRLRSVFLEDRWGIHVQSIHSVLQTVAHIVFPSQKCLEPTQKLLLGLKRAFLKRTQALAIIELNDLMRMAENGMKGLVARGLHFINCWISKMPCSRIQIANTKSIGLTE